MLIFYSIPPLFSPVRTCPPTTVEKFGCIAAVERPTNSVVPSPAHIRHTNALGTQQGWNCRPADSQSTDVPEHLLADSSIAEQFHHPLLFRDSRGCSRIKCRRTLFEQQVMIERFRLE